MTEARCDAMAEPQLRRPWWKRKRWWAVGITWFGLLWPMSAGPASWAVNQGWMPVTVYSACFSPVMLLIRETPARSAYRDYMFRWSPFADEKDPLEAKEYKELWDRWWRTKAEERAAFEAAAAEAAADAALSARINRTHWTPAAAEDGINRTHWTPAGDEP